MLQGVSLALPGGARLILDGSGSALRKGGLTAGSGGFGRSPAPKGHFWVPAWLLWGLAPLGESPAPCCCPAQGRGVSGAAPGSSRSGGLPVRTHCHLPPLRRGQEPRG